MNRRNLQFRNSGRLLFKALNRKLEKLKTFSMFN